MATLRRTLNELVSREEGKNERCIYSTSEKLIFQKSLMEDKSCELTNMDLVSGLPSEETMMLSSTNTDSDTRPFIAQAEAKNRSDISRRPRSHIAENVIIVWLDSNIKESDKDYQHTVAQLQCITTLINIFSDVDECVDFITQIKDGQIFMVISSDFGYNIIPLIHQILQLHSVYIFCAYGSYNEPRIHKWKKVKGVFNQIELICGLLKRYLHLSDNSFISFTVLSKTESSKTPVLDELDRSFMYSLLLKEIFLDIEDEDQTKKELVAFWRLQYSDNNAMLKIIDKFEHEYDHNFSIWWYTKEGFIYSTVNRALREFHIDIILKMRFFIRDLHKQIEQIFTDSSNKQSILTVYRGQSILNADFEKITNSKGGLLSFNNFLSTSADREISLLFAESAELNCNLTSVLFRLAINNMTNTYPYASVNNMSYYESENEILFSMHTIFRIGDVINIGDRLFEIHLTLTNDNDHQLKNLTNHIREEIGGGGTGWHRLGNLMIRLGEFEKAKEVYVTLLHSTQDSDRTEMAHLYHQLGFIEKEKGDLMAALSYFQKTVDTQQQYLSPNDPSLAITYNRIGSIRNTMGDHQIALSYYQKALDIQKKSLPSYHPDAAMTYSNMGDTYYTMGDYSTALSFYQMTLEVQQECLPPNDPSLATTNSCIGGVYNETGNYEAALSFYQKALDIEQKFLPLDHPSLGSTYNNIGDVHHEMGDYTSALTLYEKALQIQQKTYSADHISFATTYGRIGGIYQTMGEYASALSFYQKSLEIQKKSLPPHHPEFAVSYVNIGTIHDSMGEYSDALLFYQKALEIQEKSVEINNCQLSGIYNNLGNVYQSMKDYSTALSYYEKTFELWKKSSPPNYPRLASIYGNLGVVHDLMEDYSKALAFYKQAIEIKEKCLPPNHISFATIYNNIGDAYRSIGDYPSALSYLRKTLAIEQNCLPAEHPDLAITYNNIAKVFTGLHEYNSAVEYAERAIKIARHALGSTHPDVHLFQDNLNKILEKLRLMPS